MLIFSTLAARIAGAGWMFVRGGCQVYVDVLCSVYSVVCSVAVSL